MTMNLLLLSNSTNPGENYLQWTEQYISDFLHEVKVKKLLFIPYAGVNLKSESISSSYDLYETKVRQVFNKLGFDIQSIHHEPDPVAAVNACEALAVGGGNTFYLVYMMHKLRLMDPIRRRALGGMPFMGWSAGANVACPTLRTTNDMPIFQPQSFNCLDLIPFQINPHYLDAHPEGHGGETRQQRIEEFLTVNRDVTVAGLREASLFRLKGGRLRLMGRRNMRLFRFGQEPQEFPPDSDLSFLLQPAKE